MGSFRFVEGLGSRSGPELGSLVRSARPGKAQEEGRLDCDLGKPLPIWGPQFRLSKPLSQSRREDKYIECVNRLASMQSSSPPLG